LEIGWRGWGNLKRIAAVVKDCVVVASACKYRIQDQISFTQTTGPWSEFGPWNKGWLAYVNDHKRGFATNVFEFQQTQSQFYIKSLTMPLKELNFITGNHNKLAEVKAILGDLVSLNSQSLDLTEIQGTIEEISKDKCRRAAAIVKY